MKVDGACHCGKITFEAQAEPEKASICHCTDCQTLSGTAFRVNVPVPESDFRLLTGTPKTYIKIAESGAQRVQAFCGDCGSPLFATSPEGEKRILGIRVGALKQSDQFVPGRQIWGRSKLQWLVGLPGVEVATT